LQHDARIDQGKFKKNESSLPSEEFAFGKPNRPSTPINGIISNFYGDSAVNEIEEKYQMQYEIKKQSKGQNTMVKHTKAQEKA